MTRIETLADIETGLRALTAADPRLEPIARMAGDIPLRRLAPDYAGLAQIVTGQLVSVASAAAIFKRLEASVVPLTAEEIARVNDATLAEAGLSRPKIRTLRAVSEACLNGLDLAALANRPAEEAHATLCELKGIGRWSADIFLLFCAGHRDVFPSGDLALQVAVEKALGLPERPKPAELDKIAQDWAPWRAVAARLFWAWYRVYKNGSETMPV
ncbi:DNA-3-methyladenine glycosylase [Roseibium sp. RKSG952]|uniref:DNA-3-methyladenine glycosylase family protein n=1 Tax=Roseibium sp. RKSG952 TaxID=2529384 RepID=UPI0012BD796F|nr:DNA-3-methyladenine glycosylase [Roseibium sp. RKSG952]MTH98202.1 DNA-3-methyladenine glycosylase 2 family protein [Roseibium sp. RKSG952]